MQAHVLIIIFVNLSHLKSSKLITCVQEHHSFLRHVTYLRDNRRYFINPFVTFA